MEWSHLRNNVKIYLVIYLSLPKLCVLAATGETIWEKEQSSADSSLCRVLCNTNSVLFKGSWNSLGGGGAGHHICGGGGDGQLICGGGGDGQFICGGGGQLEGSSPHVNDTPTADVEVRF